MSVRFPEVNAERTGNLACRLGLPNDAANKAANVSHLTLFWFRTPPGGYEQPYAYTLLARDDGSPSGGNSAVLSLNQDANTLSFSLRNGGSSLISTSLTGLVAGRTYLGMLIANNGNAHLVACEPGGTPLVQTVANTTLYSTAMTTIDLWASIAGGNHGSNRPYFGLIEEVCMWNGSGTNPVFPETAGVPDLTLIANIASGAQDLDTLHTAISPNISRRFRYRLRDETDLADAFGLRGNLTPANVDRAVGSALYTSGPLRPQALMPAFTTDAISQAVFTRPGDVSSAAADIRITGGGYSGITPAKIQARLLDEAQSVVRDWIDVDTAPEAGVWTGNTSFTAVPLTASYLRVEFRALDAGGTVIAGPTPGYGLRGAGFRLLTQAQSQLMFLFQNGGGLALPSGIRAISSGPDRQWLLSSANGNTRGVYRGIRQAMIEINARFPGVPVQIDTVGVAGNPLSNFYGVGVHAGRWATLRDRLGIIQPYVMLFMGHSESTTGYQAQVASAVAWAEANHGVPILYLHAPVPRYHGAGSDESAGGNAMATRDSRRGQRAFVLANPAMHRWAGNWSSVWTSETGSDPHPSDNGQGQGRSGGLIAWALMAAVRAVPDRPLGISRVRADGADAVIEFGTVG